MANTFLQLPQLDVALSAPVTFSDDRIKIWDGLDILSVNPDGSINVKNPIVNDLQFAEVSSVVASGTYTVILTKVCLAGTILYSYEVSGSNVAEYIVTLNNVTIDHKWSNATNFSVSGNLGPTMQAGDTVQILVRHQRPTAGDFSAKLFYGK